MAVNKAEVLIRRVLQTLALLFVKLSVSHLVKSAKKFPQNIFAIAGLRVCHKFDMFSEHRL